MASNSSDFLPATRAPKLICVCALLLVAAAFLSVPASTYLQNLAVDDGVYYLVIARSLAAGQGSTFDGMMQTNGYHPLWAYMMTPLMAVTDNLYAQVHLVKILIVIVTSLALLIWYRLVRAETGDEFTAILVVSVMGCFYSTLRIYYTLPEAPLVTLLLGLVFLAARAFRMAPSAAWAALLGLLAGLCFLARLDSALVMLPLGLALAWVMRRRVALSVVALVAAAMVALPYLWWNWKVFDSIVPVSGLVKRRPDPSIRFLFQEVGGFLGAKLESAVASLGLILVILAAAALAIGCFFLRKQLVISLRRLGWLWLLIAGSAVHLGYNTIFQKESFVEWYLYAFYPALFLVAAAILRTLVDTCFKVKHVATARSSALAVLVIGLLAFLAIQLRTKMPLDPRSPAKFEAAVWARDHLSRDTIHMMHDAGLFRLISGQRTINLNRLIGDQRLPSLSVEQIVELYGVEYSWPQLRLSEIGSADAAMRGIEDRTVYRSHSFLYGVPKAGRYSELWEIRGVRVGPAKLTCAH